MKKIPGIFIFLSLISSLFASPDSIVVQVSFNSAAYASFDTAKKNLVSATYNQFLHDLTLVKEISIRNSDNDKQMRMLQKQSQIDAVKGLGNEQSVYSAEKGSRSDLALNFSFNQIEKDSYQIVCTLSEIETMRLFATETTKRLSFSKITKEETVDELAYQVIADLEQRGFIPSVSSRVIAQLHKNSSTEPAVAASTKNKNPIPLASSDSSEWLEIGKRAFENSNFKVAFEYLSKSKNTAETYYYLGYMYEMGYGTNQNLKKAAVLYDISSGQGYQDAQYRLGLCFYNGWGVPRNFQKARALFQQAAEQGHTESKTAFETFKNLRFMAY